MMISQPGCQLINRVRSLAKKVDKQKYPVELRPITSSIRGRVLLSYLAQSVHLADDSSALNAHSNTWESREIARIFRDLDYEVDVIDWSDRTFFPTRNYDVLFDIAINVSRLSSIEKPPAIKIVHRTGSDPYYQNAAEMRRVENVNLRKNANYHPKRMVKEPEIELESIHIADYCSLLGNQHTLETYPSKYHDKITLLPVSGSYLGDSIKSPTEYVPLEREFIWFFGSGAVHKGLDLVLEVFARNPDCILNIVGNISHEEDFIEIYQYELNHLNNIRYHGWLDPSSSEFQQIVERSFCFIAPTCSEGTSPAVVTCLQIGLFPIISRDTGVTLPLNTGIYLERNTLDEIEQRVLQVVNMSRSKLEDQIELIQNEANKYFSRNNFRYHMEKFIRGCLQLQ